MISGFFCCNGNEYVGIHVIYKKVCRIGKIALTGTVLYLMFNIFHFGIEYILDQISVSNLIKFIVFNAPQITSAHLWFLFSLIYVYILFYLILKCNFQKQIPYFIVILLSVHLIISEFLIFHGVVFAHPIVRNAYLFGLPFFLIGYQVRVHIERIRIPQKVYLIILIAVGILMSVLERLYLSKGDLLELYFGSIILSVTLFVISVKNPLRSNGLLRKIGKDYSLGIYIIHPMVGSILTEVLVRLNIEKNMAIGCISPLVVIVISILSAVLWGVLKNFISGNFTGINFRI